MQRQETIYIEKKWSWVAHGLHSQSISKLRCSALATAWLLKGVWYLEVVWTVFTCLFYFPCSKQWSIVSDGLWCFNGVFTSGIFCMFAYFCFLFLRAILVTPHFCVVFFPSRLRMKFPDPRLVSRCGSATAARAARAQTPPSAEPRRLKTWQFWDKEIQRKKQNVRK